MPELLNPLPIVRGAGRLLVGAVRIGTAPARAAIGLAELLVEEVAGALSAPQAPPEPGAVSDAYVPDATANGGASGPDAAADGAGPAPVTPAVARDPSRKRRR